jgi:hypothetical protein
VRLAAAISRCRLGRRLGDGQRHAKRVEDYAGRGNQTVLGAKGDTLIGGQAPSTLADPQRAGRQRRWSAAAPARPSSAAIDWGGANDSITAGSGTGQQIVSPARHDVVAGTSGSATISAAAQDRSCLLTGSTQTVIIAASSNDLIDLTGNAPSGPAPAR